MSSRPVFLASVCLVGCVMLAGCDRMPGRPSATDIELKPENVRDFTALYRLNCAGCHGENGQGNAALALNNPVYLALASDEVLRRATATGVPGTLMPAFQKSAGGTLTAEQIDILVRGMRAGWGRADALEGTTPPAYAASRPGHPVPGAQAYEKYCAACHGISGTGGAKAGAIVDDSYLALVSDQGLRTTIMAGRPELGHPDWRHYITEQPITDQELTDLVAWLGSKRVTSPGQPYPVSK